MIRTRERRAKVGMFAIGLNAYWEQFAGLKERLEGYQQGVEERIGQWAAVVSPGLVDTAPKAYAAGRRFAEERVDLIFCHAATYATSSQVLPAVQEAGCRSFSTSSPTPRSTTRTRTPENGWRTARRAAYWRSPTPLSGRACPSTSSPGRSKVARLLSLQFVAVGEAGRG